MTDKNGSDTVQVKSVVSVALATDSRYLAPTLVAVKSIVLHASDQYHYAVYILSDKPLNLIEKKMLLSAAGSLRTVQIIFIAVGNKIGRVRLSDSGSTKGITQATYFRFLLPSLLKDQDKVLYMDADAIALDDISQIFSYDLEEGDIIGGVRDIAGHEAEESRCKELNIDSLDQYVNAGVLTFNLNEMRRCNYEEKMLRLAQERSFPYNDQDIINSLCYGRIRVFPFRYNVIVDYLNAPEGISRTLGLDYMKETERPVILHYAGRSKPWYQPTHHLSSHWWKIADSFTGPAGLIFRFYMNRLVK